MSGYDDRDNVQYEIERSNVRDMIPFNGSNLPNLREVADAAKARALILLQSHVACAWIQSRGEETGLHISQKVSTGGAFRKRHAHAELTIQTWKK